MTPQEIRQKTLDAQDLPREVVPCPEWDTVLYVRTLTGDEQATLMEIEGNRSVYIHTLVAMVTCDVDGHAIYSLADVAKLRTKCGKAIMRLFRKGLELNAVDDAAVAEAKKNLADE